jgi:hypothetical protein
MGLPGDSQSPIGSATPSNRCCALPHRSALQGAPTCSCLRPAPVSASPCPGTTVPSVVLARWLLPYSQAPPALDAPTQGLASILVVHCAVTAPRWGVRSCPSVDICSRHGACRQGTLVPGEAGVGWRIPWGLGTPRPPPGRSGLLFDWSFTAGLCAAVSPAGPVLPQRQPAVLLGRLAGVLLSRASPGSRCGCQLLRRFSSPGKATQCNPGGTTSRAGLAALGAPEGAPLTLSSPPGLATQRQEKKNTNAAATGPYGPGDAEHNV